MEAFYILCRIFFLFYFEPHPSSIPFSMSRHLRGVPFQGGGRLSAVMWVSMSHYIRQAVLSTRHSNESVFCSLFLAPCCRRSLPAKRLGGREGFAWKKHFKNIVSVTPRLTKLLQTHCIGTAQGPSNETGLLKGKPVWIHYTREGGNSRLLFHKKIIGVFGLWAAITKTLFTQNIFWFIPCAWSISKQKRIKFWWQKRC